MFVFFSAGQSQEMDRNMYKFNKHPLIKDRPNVVQLNCVACIYHRKRQVFLLSSDVLTFWLQNPGSSMFDAIFNRLNKSFFIYLYPWSQTFFWWFSIQRCRYTINSFFYLKQQFYKSEKRYFITKITFIVTPTKKFSLQCCEPVMTFMFF